jgi:hypothetical protein
VIPRLAKFLAQQMLADDDLTDLVADRIYEAQASGAVSLPAPGDPKPWPESPSFPCVRFKVFAAPHTRGNGARRGPTKATVLIEGIDSGESLQALQPIADRLTALFAFRAEGTVDGLTICGSHMVEDRDVTDDNLPQTYKRLGGFFEFFCHQAE